MRIRIFFSTLVTLTLITGLAVAGGQPEGDSPEGTNPEISILINTSPWLPGFEAIVEKYIEETGNPVRLDVNPFPAMLPQVPQRRHRG
jgi:multiple sugar transport system substrate-binding protein